MTIKELSKSFIMPMLIGGCCLSGLSAVQKFILNYTLYPTSFILPFAAGAIAGLFHALRLIQANKYRDSFKKQNIRLNTIFETSNCGIMIVDSKTCTITSINPAVTELLDCETNEIIGKKCYDVISCNCSGNCHLNENYYNISKLEDTSIKFDNKEYFIMRKAKKVDIDDHPYTIISFMDVTPIVESNKKVQQANDRVKKADRLKTEFLMNVGHEIRTPLNAVVGISDLLMDTDDLSGDHKGDIELIKNSGVSLLKTMENIIDYSIIKSGNYKKFETEFNVLDSITLIASTYEDMANKKGLSVKINVDPCQGTTIIGDKSAFEKIINNILDNAVKYTKTGSITFECQISIADSPQICLHISDTGVGIPENHYDYIFDAFYQVDGSMKKEYKGTGMGLAIVDFYIQQMGGSFDFESSVGKGTTFHVILPIKLKA